MRDVAGAVSAAHTRRLSSVLWLGLAAGAWHGEAGAAGGAEIEAPAPLRAGKEMAGGAGHLCWAQGELRGAAARAGVVPRVMHRVRVILVGVDALQLGQPRTLGEGTIRVDSIRLHQQLAELRKDSDERLRWRPFVEHDGEAQCPCVLTA